MAPSSLTTVLTLTLLLFSTGCSAARLTPKTETEASTEFIKTSCSATEYPELCYSSLSAYASTIQTSPMELTRTALSVSLASARATSSSMSKIAVAGRMGPRDSEAMQDCMDNLGDAVSDLSESMDTMDHMRGKNMGFQINSVQTWVSAALTDDNTCMDGFAGSEKSVKMEVRGQVLNVAHLTCNALALLNGLSSSVHHVP